MRSQVQWYVQLSTGPRGPFTSGQLFQLAQSGEVTPESLVRRGEGGDWHKASQVKGLFAPPPPAKEEAFESTVLEALGATDPEGKTLGAPIPLSSPEEVGVEDSLSQSPPQPTAVKSPPDRPGSDSAVLDSWEILLRLVAIVEIGIGWIRATAIALDTGMAGRFHTDNAVGATANALEQILPILVTLPHLLLGISLFLYVELRRIRRAVSASS